MAINKPKFNKNIQYKDMKNLEIIKLEQPAIIDYKGIEEVSKEVDETINSLNLENQVATVHTVKSLKQTRAELNKQFRTYEEQRKFVKTAFTKPYSKFEQKYKELIAVKFQKAESVLKEKILTVEGNIKNEKKEQLKNYFSELCKSKSIDFLSFDDLNINITLSASEKSLKEKILTNVEEVEKDLNLIKSLPESDEFKTDVLIDYKNSLDLNSSLRLVQERRKQKQQELERIEKQKQQELEVEIKQESKVEPLQPLSAPKVDEATKTLEATLTVKGTLEQLKGLKQYIIENNIELLK